MLDEIDDMIETNLGLANAASLADGNSEGGTGTSTPDLGEGAALKPTKSTLEENAATDPKLTEPQLVALANLNSIPQMTKYLGYFPTARNAVSICTQFHSIVADYKGHSTER